MWLKILKYAVIAAKATGLDKKIKGWVLDKIGKAEDKAVDKLVKVRSKVDQIKEKLEG